MQAGQTLRLEGKRLTIKEQLGKGAFGVVNRVEEKGSSAEYALKDILCENLDKSTIENALREVGMLKNISHENIIRIVGASTFEDEHVLILMEYSSGGNLNERLARASDEEENAKWMSQTAGALVYLHSRKIVHRDLKPDNVLLSDPINEDVKLADFGLAREYLALKRKDVQLDDEDSWTAMYTQYYMDTFAGTPHWMAPEVFKAHYTEKSDVFSLGVICFAILERDYVQVGKRNYYGAFVERGGKKVGLGYSMAKLDQAIRAKFSPEAQGSDALQQIVLDALQYKGKDRPSAKIVHQRIRSAATE